MEEENSEKEERAIQELTVTNERAFGLVISQGSASVMDGLKEELYRELREKIEMLDNARVAKAVNLELEVRKLGESLKISRDEEALMRAKILELEQSVGVAVEKEEEMARKYKALASEKEEMEKSIEALTAKRDEVVLEKDKMRKGFEVEKGKVENLELKVADLEKKIEQGEFELGQMGSEREKLNERNKELESNVDVLMKENDALMKEKTKVENLELQVAKLEKKIEQGESELGQMTSEGEKLNERNKELESNVELHNALLEASDDIIQYPDTGFHDFGKDKAGDFFAVDQFWASNDCPDGLPRYYALVRNVEAASAFKLKITWLEPDPDDQGKIDWRDAELPIACGKFKLGASEDVTDLSIFTHQMHCVETSGEGSYMVYPKEGETWAIFRDWDIKWSCNPQNHLRGEFEYVEILSDFTQNVGIEVAYLVKVKGFVSLFQKTEKNGVNISCVLPNELYRFSHRIPSYKMTDEDRKVAPRGCFELDAALLPTKYFAKTSNLELEMRKLSETLKISRNEEALMRAKILELEQSFGLAVEKEEEMARKYSALVSENKEMEKSIEVLTEKRDSILESKQRELDEVNRARDEIDQVRISHEYKISELLGEVGRVRDVVDELNGSFREFKEKNEQLLSQVAGMEKNEQLLSQIHQHRNAIDEVMLEKDNMIKGFEEEKTRVENLELQVAGMKEKLELADTELGQMRSERDMELNVDVLKKPTEALHLKAQGEWDDLNSDVRNKRRSPTEETSLMKKGKFEQYYVQGENVLESDPDFRMSKVDTYSPLNSNASSGPENFQCPDTDFNDFGKDKAEDCFAVNQFWAIYDDKDGLPRFYALVRKVAPPFKLKITWLEPDPDDGGEVDWHCADLPVACGKFKLGASQHVTDRNKFSHQLQCMEISGEGSYLVYPKKGETWAIFRDWNTKWSSNPENHLTDEFEYVEILSDFDENVGIEVAYLVKVKGFVSLVQKTKKNEVNISFVLPSELYRFSHRIPSYKMTGKERKGVPKGCFELDTLAVPTKFFA